MRWIIAMFASGKPRVRKAGFFSKLGRIATVIALLGSLAISTAGGRDEELALSEYEVKALFLFNFARYVDWPARAFGTADSPIIIGVAGESRFGDNLQKAVSGRNVSGRRLVIQTIAKPEDRSKCHILFVAASEKAHSREILESVRSAPVLTVGEADDFVERGGTIRFLKKEGKVRLEIDLATARRSGLQISSKLLAVADVVHGKTEGGQ